MILIGILLAAAGAGVALAAKPITDWLPWAWADGAVVWLKPWAWHLCALGIGITIGAMFT